MSKYSSVFKNAKDLLTKPFTYDNKVEVKTKAANGAVFTSDAAIKGDGSAAANVKVAYKHSDNFSVEKLAIGSSKKIEGEFKLANAAPGTDATFKFTEGSRAASASNDATLGVVYKSSGSVNAVFTADAELVNGPNFDFSALFNFNGVLVGGATSVNTTFAKAGDAKDSDKSVAVADYNALLGYRTDDFTLAAQTTKALSHVDVSLLHNASDSVTAGFIASFDRAGGSKPFGFTVGGTYKVDSDTSVSGTADSAGKVSLAYKQKLNSLATLTTSGQVDALQLGSDNHKFGLSLSLSS
jgi:hypothetical protein